MDYLCRFCLDKINSQKKPKTIFSLINDTSIASIAEKCADIEIEIDDNLPKSVCLNCFLKFQEHVNFMKEIQTVDKTLKGNQITSNIVIFSIIDEDDEIKSKINEDEFLPCIENVVENNDTNVEEILIENEMIENGFTESYIIEDTTYYNFIENDMIQDAMENSDTEKDITKDDAMEEDIMVNNMEEDIIEEDFFENNVTEKDVMENSVLEKGIDLENINEKNDVQKELKNSLLDISEKLYCSRCEESFPSVGSFKRHNLIAHRELEICGKLEMLDYRPPAEITQTKCPICEDKEESTLNKTHSEKIKRKQMKTKERLRNGQKRKSRKNFKINKKCNLCNEVCYNVVDLRNHMRDHIAKKFLCEICGNRYFRECALTNHKNICHVNKVKCNQCSKWLTTDSQKQHKCSKKPIQKKKKLLCTICGKPYKNKKLHICMHRGEKPFQCMICPKRYALQAILNKHMYDHMFEKMYVCLKCEKDYMSLTSIKKHILGVHFKGKTAEESEWKKYYRSD